MENVPLEKILDLTARPNLNKYGSFYHFFIISVKVSEEGNLSPLPIDFLVGKNFVVTIHDEEVEYFKEFEEREKGKTQIGELDAESFIATLLDLHIVTYFQALEIIERLVDKLDEAILQEELRDEIFFTETVKLRSSVSKLRRWFIPHRDVFYALSRPDFKQITDSDSFDNFQLLNKHFENAVYAIENSRETVLSLFDLYTSKASHRMNNAMKRLTFTALLVGGMGVIAGTLGMNFKEDFFDSSNGFWIAIGIMFLISSSVTFFAWRKSWI